MPSQTPQDALRLQREAHATTSAWDRVRSQYAEGVAASVDAMIESGGITLQDLIAISFAEHQAVVARRRRLPSGEISERLRLTDMAVSLRRQLHQLIDSTGGGVNPDILVPVPSAVDDLVSKAIVNYAADLTADDE